MFSRTHALFCIASYMVQHSSRWLWAALPHECMATSFPHKQHIHCIQIANHPWHNCIPLGCLHVAYCCCLDALEKWEQQAASESGLMNIVLGNTCFTTGAIAGNCASLQFSRVHYGPAVDPE